jgi:uncharacterized protein (TIGR02145 family)
MPVENVARSIFPFFHSPKGRNKSFGFKFILLAIIVLALVFAFFYSGGGGLLSRGSELLSSGGELLSSIGGGGGGGSGGDVENPAGPANPIKGGGGDGGNPGNSGGYTGSYGSVKDAAGKSYKTVKIGTQTWMAENLNYNVAGSKCYNNDPANCAKYGRLYDWSTAMALPSCNNSVCSSRIQPKHKGICPSGWHIPSDAEWDVLMTAVGGSSTAGIKLKAKSGWNNTKTGSSGNGTDEFRFSTLPGGLGLSSSSFNNVGYFGFWWSAAERGSNGAGAYSRLMGYDGSAVSRYLNSKSDLVSVRCVQD